MFPEFMKLKNTDIRKGKIFLFAGKVEGHERAGENSLIEGLGRF